MKKSKNQSGLSAAIIAICSIFFISCAGSSESVSTEMVEPTVAGSTPKPKPTPRPSATPTPRPSATPTPVPTATPAPTSKVFGVTMDSIANIDETVLALSKFAVRPTARIVFDEWVAASYYTNAVGKVAAVSTVMGELLDSYYVKDYTLAQYSARTREYLSALGSKVQIWEIGNEINGEWLGAIPDVVAKMTSAYDIVDAAGGKTALTLYYNKDCWMYPTEEMFAWAEKNVPARMKTGLDYIWVSYYEDDCNGLQPDWPAVFNRLGEMFPNSKMGLGETGTTNASLKATYINRYYNMTINHPRYVGGYFWWYFIQDMVPWTKPLWSTLNTAAQ